MSPPKETTLKGLKTQAKALRTALSEKGQTVSHSEALELLARQMGARDWNTLAATAEATPNRMEFAPGMELGGLYLGQAFRGTVLGAQVLNAGQRTRLTIEFDAPVNVTPEASFEVFRRRINATVDAGGRTFEETSDGKPHLQITDL